jgi:hypothetical protein
MDDNIDIFDYFPQGFGQKLLYGQKKIRFNLLF